MQCGDRIVVVIGRGSSQGSSMSDEGKMAEQAASTTAPPEGKNGVDITAAASGVNSGGSGAAQGSEEAEGEIDEDESCPKVSGKSKMDSALSAPRTPYAKPQGEKTYMTIYYLMC